VNASLVSARGGLTSLTSSLCGDETPAIHDVARKNIEHAAEMEGVFTGSNRLRKECGEIEELLRRALYACGLLRNLLSRKPLRCHRAPAILSGVARRGRNYMRYFNVNQDTAAGGLL
jgi:hypothetical protein